MVTSQSNNYDNSKPHLDIKRQPFAKIIQPKKCRKLNYLSNAKSVCDFEPPIKVMYTIQRGN